MNKQKAKAVSNNLNISARTIGLLLIFFGVSRAVNIKIEYQFIIVVFGALVLLIWRETINRKWKQ